MSLICWVIHYRSYGFANERKLKKNFLHLAVRVRFVNVTGDGVDTSNVPQ